MTEFNSQKQRLAEKLKRAREDRMKQLRAKQEAEREQFVKETEDAKPKEVVEVRTGALPRASRRTQNKQNH